jgi:hypothetical protein
VAAWSGAASTTSREPHPQLLLLLPPLPPLPQAWAGEWLGVWARVCHCTYWDNHW